MSESNQPTIEIRDLHHAYKRQQALLGVSFALDNGSIHGFVGPNGAGKTTTLKILSTLLKPPRGSVRVFGLDVVADYKQVRRKIGFMPDHFSLYRQMTVQEYLDFFGAAYGMDLAERTRGVGDVLALTDMEARRNDLIRDCPAACSSASASRGCWCTTRRCYFWTNPQAASIPGRGLN